MNDKQQASNEKQTLLRKAHVEALAANAILLDRRTWPSCALPHLVDGWTALLQAVAPLDKEQSPDLAKQIRQLASPSVSKKKLERVGEFFETVKEADLAGSAPSKDHSWKRTAPKLACKVLGIITHHELNQLQEKRYHWKIALAVAGLIVLSLIGMYTIDASQLVGRSKDHGWLGRYYANIGFGQTPKVRYDDTIQFEWLHGSPFSGFPADRFSVRWETCFQAQAEETLLFELGSDDGSRLFIDGKLAINMWRNQAGNWMSHKATLSKGWHQLRVEYYESGGSAMVVLRVKDEKGPLDPMRLIVPAFQDSQAICGGHQ